MRWERLFADLEAQFDAESRVEHEADRADLARAERGQIELADRLRAHLGATLIWWLHPGTGAGGSLTATLTDLGADWLLLRPNGSSGSSGPGRHLLLPSRSVLSVGGLSREALLDDRAVTKRMGLTVVLRGLARDRSPVQVVIAGERVPGTIDRVGRDHIDLAVHELDLPRHPRQVRQVRTVPLAALAMIALRDAPGD